MKPRIRIKNYKPSYDCLNDIAEIANRSFDSNISIDHYAWLTNSPRILRLDFNSSIEFLRFSRAILREAHKTVNLDRLHELTISRADEIYQHIYLHIQLVKPKLINLTEFYKFDINHETKFFFNFIRNIR